MPLFSIITPTYNRADLLPEMIQSVLDQTFADWELLIIDDGSVDHTADVVKAYTTDSRIKYIKKENSGAADSRNVGADCAVGSFLVFLDSDDIALENWLEQVSLQILSDTGLICVAALRSFENGKKIIEDPLFETSIFGNNQRLKFTAGSFFIRKDLFFEVGKYDSQMSANQHTDLGFRLMIVLKGKKLKVLPIEKPLVQINVHEGDRIRTNWEKIRHGNLRFIEKHHDFMSNSDKRGISNFYAISAFASYKLKQRKDSLTYMIKAIKYNPGSYINYVRLVRYLL
ncbi:glycosyltransferase family 2 protein [Pontibacter oryzae]|uniref:Glycosyltransferase family 2 protein n=1 Tax=Pontibacter oryzae TaxID=2304593 RepID=A0A399SLX1_9BACT|nr:glycosyltransferase family A protein [Pontibacter oryzae]RIJ42775.1 glycosyltransferase family 2 protein [Pontibacter oryzae]